ncbi:hypothetical protein ACVGVM_27985 (plasmid) [Pseudonocardia bannensis]|uniref:Uncharacterized protein n=1 Tax=Pseudonocardia bannensis TaxID=630973 RepID=A0A848DIJ1_9PSEU|nr:MULTISPECIES: hypothetical protein [Pseudonocardia]NMH92385.1 hypothetical protein [Pseudonocardia bannensis]
MVTPSPPSGADSTGPAGERALLIDDRLDMLVTGEPVAEIDDTLGCLGRQLRDARSRHETEAATRLRRWIDGRLDERNSFRPEPPTPPPAARDPRTPANAGPATA